MATRKLKTITNATNILTFLQEADGATMKEISNEMNMANSTVHGYLASLQMAEYVVEENGEYQLSLAFLNKGEYARRRKEEYNLAEEIIKSLADSTGQRAYFIVEQGGRGIYVHTKTGNPNVKLHGQIGKYDYLHASSAGKAILAYLSTDAVHEIIEKHGLPRLTKHTITSEEKLFEELANIRDTRLSYNIEESIEGLYAVGSPVMNQENDVIGSISVSGAKNTLEGELIDEILPEQVLGAVNELELNINNLRDQPI